MERPLLGNWKTGERTVLPHHTEEQKQDTKVRHHIPLPFERWSARHVSYRVSCISCVVEQKQKMHVSAVSFNKKGDKIYTGDAKGFITIIDTKTLEVLDALLYHNTSSLTLLHTHGRTRLNTTRTDVIRSNTRFGCPAGAPSNRFSSARAGRTSFSTPPTVPCERTLTALWDQHRLPIRFLEC